MEDYVQRTDTDIANELLKAVAPEHFAEHLLRIVQLIFCSAVLLPELIVLVPQLRIGQDLVRDCDLLELRISCKHTVDSGLRTFSSASGSSRFLSGCSWRQRHSWIYAVADRRTLIASLRYAFLISSVVHWLSRPRIS